MDRSRFPPEKIRKRAPRGPLPAALKINKQSRKIVKIPRKTLQYRIPLLYLIRFSLLDAPLSPARASAAPTQEASDVVQPHTGLPGSSRSRASDNPSSSVGSVHCPGISGNKNSGGGESSSMADPGRTGDSDSMDAGFMHYLGFPRNQDSGDGSSMHCTGIFGSKNSGESSSMADPQQPGNSDSMDGGFMHNPGFPRNQDSVAGGFAINNPFVKEYTTSDLVPNFDVSPTSPDMAHFDPQRFLNDDI